MDELRFDTRVGEIDLFESVYSDFEIKGDELTISWLNVGLFEHPLNPKGLDEIRYIYDVKFELSGICLVIKNRAIIYNTSSMKEGPYNLLQLEGINTKTRELDGFEFFCKESCIAIPGDYRISEASWLQQIR